MHRLHPPDDLAAHFTDLASWSTLSGLEEAAEAFLQYCRSGGNAPYLATKTLHGILKPEETRPLGLKLVQALKGRTKGAQDEHFRIETLDIETAGRRHRLDVLVLPSIFTPEDWGYTFLEGLLRRPLEDYDDKTLVEVGCGSGWISIALAKFTELRSIVGLDINPRAVVVSEVNALINSYDEAGRPLYDRSRRLVFERFEVKTSNLLQEVIQAGRKVDFIIGCIPQVLSPDENLDLARLSEYSDAKLLGDLGNYCALQGVFEDQFGLGLNAALLEESVRCLKRDGRVILNLAGRPGDGVIHLMFTRRGFEPKILWKSRVPQASDTNIEPLVNLERRMGSDFHFFMNQASSEPINAQTARELREAGGDLWHDLLVYEARMRDPVELIELDRLLGQLGLTPLKREIDLTAMHSDQLAFINRMAVMLRDRRKAPYVHECGSLPFRTKLASFLSKQYQLDLDAERVFVGPQREQIAFSLLVSLCNPGDRVLVSRNLADRYRLAARKAGVQLTVANNTLEEIHQLMGRFSPKVALVAIADRERKNWSSLRRMLETPQTAVILDETDHLALSQEAPANDVLDFLTREGLFHAAIVMAEFSAPETFPSFTATAVAHANQELMRNLAIMAEVTYSRMSLVVEEFFLKRVEEALAFSIVPQGGLERPRAPAPARQALRFSNRIIQANDAPAFEEVAESDAVIRLDYGENELPIPQRLVQGLLKGLFDRPGPALEGQVKGAIAAYLAETRQLSYGSDEIVLGQGVIPLIGDTIRAVARRTGRSHVTVALPRGHYGVFPPLIQLSDATLQLLEAEPGVGFKVTLEALERLPYPPDALLLVNPNNPSGLYYDRNELLAIARFAVTHHVTILSDEIFALTGDPERFVSLASLERDVPGLAERVVSFGGLSKEFAAGGLRVGFAVGRDRDLMRELEALSLGPVDAVAMRAAETLWGAFRRTDLGRLVDETAYHEVVRYLDLQREQLANRHQRLRQVLEGLGLAPEATWEGGLFLLAPTSAWHGRTWRGPDRTVRLDESNLASILREGAGLRVNPGEWTGAPGHVRMVFALEDRRFNEALKRLHDFANQLETTS